MNVWLYRFFITSFIFLLPHFLQSATLREYLETNNKVQAALAQKNVDEAQKHINQIFQWLRADKNQPVLQQLHDVFNKDAAIFFNEQQRYINLMAGPEVRRTASPQRVLTFLKGVPFQPPAPPIMPVPRPPTTPPPGQRPVLPKGPSTPPAFLPQAVPPMSPALPLTTAEKPSIKAAAEYSAFIDNFEKFYEEAEAAKNYKQYKDATQKMDEAAKVLKYLEMRFARDESNPTFLQEIEKDLAKLYSKIQPPRNPYNLTQSLRQKRVKFNKLVNRFLLEQIDLIEKIIKEQVKESDLKEVQQKSSVAIQMNDDRKKLAKVLTKIKTEHQALYAKLPPPQLLKANRVLTRIRPAS